MRKSFVFLLCAVLLFSGCAKYEEHTIVSFDEESRIVIENSETDQISELLIKEKKYTFEGKDLVVLDVTNITGSSLSVTINVSFFTKNGKTVKTQTQTFDQFYSGYQNYFIFEPKIKFDHFTYTVSTEEYTGTCYSEQFHSELVEIHQHDFWVEALRLQGDFETKYPTVFAKVMAKYSGRESVYYECRWILLNTNGEIAAIITSQSDLVSGIESYSSAILYQAPEEQFVFPEKFKGDLQFLVALKSIRANG